MYKDHIFINICQRLLRLCNAHSNPCNTHTKVILFNCIPFTNCHIFRNTFTDVSVVKYTTRYLDNMIKRSSLLISLLIEQIFEII